MGEREKFSFSMVIVPVIAIGVCDILLIGSTVLSYGNRIFYKRAISSDVMLVPLTGKRLPPIGISRGIGLL